LRVGILREKTLTIEKPVAHLLGATGANDKAPTIVVGTGFQVSNTGSPSLNENTKEYNYLALI
jgi:hypothetical protein